MAAVEARERDEIVDTRNQGTRPSPKNPRHRSLLLTVEELARAFGLSAKTARRRIGQLGVRPVGRVPGTTRPAFVYRLEDVEAAEAVQRDRDRKAQEKRADAARKTDATRGSLAGLDRALGTWFD